MLLHLISQLTTTGSVQWPMVRAACGTSSRRESRLKWLHAAVSPWVNESTWRVGVRQVCGFWGVGVGEGWR